MKARLLTCISINSSSSISSSSIVDRVYPLIHKTVNYSIHLFRMDVLRFQHLHVHTTHAIRTCIFVCVCDCLYVCTRVQLNEFFSFWHQKWKRMRFIITFTITLTITFTVCKRCQCFNYERSNPKVYRIHKCICQLWLCV